MVFRYCGSRTTYHKIFERVANYLENRNTILKYVISVICVLTILVPPFPLMC